MKDLYGNPIDQVQQPGPTPAYYQPQQPQQSTPQQHAVDPNQQVEVQQAQPDIPKVDPNEMVQVPLTQEENESQRHLMRLHEEFNLTEEQGKQFVDMMKRDEESANAGAVDILGLSGYSEDDFNETGTFVMVYHVPKKLRSKFGGNSKLIGTFRYTLPTIGQEREIARIKSVEMGGLPEHSFDEATVSIIHFLAHFEVCFETVPTWFNVKGSDRIYDWSPHLAVWGRFQDHLNFFRI